MGHCYLNISSGPDCLAKICGLPHPLVLFAVASVKYVFYSWQTGFEVEATREAANLAFLLAVDLGPLANKTLPFQSDRRPKGPIREVG